MKKILAVCLVLIFMLTAISGCSVNKDQTKDSTNNVTVQPGSEDTQGQDAGNTEDLASADDQDAESTEESASADDKDASVVYMTKDISPEGLVRIYQALGREATGKVAVKIHMGEPGGENYLKPDLVKDLVLSVNGTFVDSNTAYGGLRANTAAHMQAAQDHGFTAYADVDILDADGTISLPIENGKHLTEDIVGSHYENYDFIIVLSHFKGHAMGGFGGAIKNMSIGFASPVGKNMIHTAGNSEKNIWMTSPTKQEDFLESMAEAAGAVIKDAGENILYISVMNNLSVDCDCDSFPADPKMADIGIFASLDPVALDKACVDQVYAAPGDDNKDLIRRIESRKGTHTLDYAEELGLGSQNYKLVDIDE